ncbi:hypothetical protein HZA45_01960 [Candidatus Peregrinibacteria bacterium]|nr:hypothetical protein [Candidatus Peregrinibacteria bacterium]
MSNEVQKSARDLTMDCIDAAADLMDPAAGSFTDDFRKALHGKVERLVPDQTTRAKIKLFVDGAMHNERKNIFAQSSLGKRGDPTFVKFNLLNQLSIVLNS